MLPMIHSLEENFTTIHMVPFKSYECLAIMDERRLTYLELQKKAHCSEFVVNRAVRDGMATIPTIMKIAAALRVPTSKLCDFEINYTGGNKK